MTRTVLVTGASRGIGLETAMTFARGNDNISCIVMVSRPSQRFDDAVERVRSITNNVQIIPIEADLSDPDVVPGIYDKLEETGARINILVNNAGFTKPASLGETLLSDFELTMRINLYSPFRFIQEALRRDHPIEQVINIASTAGVSGRAGWLTYSASKAAVINMSEVLREELSPFGIDVICISPGRCATDLRRVLAPDEDPTTIMQPGQMAQIIATMTSDTGRLLKSQNLVVRA